MLRTHEISYEIEIYVCSFNMKCFMSKGVLSLLVVVYAFKNLRMYHVLLCLVFGSLFMSNNIMIMIMT